MGVHDPIFKNTIVYALLCGTRSRTRSGVTRFLILGGYIYTYTYIDILQVDIWRAVDAACIRGICYRIRTHVIHMDQRRKSIESTYGSQIFEIVPHQTSPQSLIAMATHTMNESLSMRLARGVV